MTPKTLRQGVLIGLVGGGTMAAFAMIAMWATGHGFFTIVNLFAHTFWAGAPLGATFDPAAFAFGLVIHIIVSVIVGTIIASLADRGQIDAGIILLLGVGIAAVVWLVQSFVWAAIDPDAHQAFTPWILASAHLVFALGAATYLNVLYRHDREAAEQALVLANGGTLSDAFSAPRPTRSGFTRNVGEARTTLQEQPTDG